MIVDLKLAYFLSFYLVDSCPIKLEPLGCYSDHNSPNRAMTDQVSGWGFI